MELHIDLECPQGPDDIKIPTHRDQMISKKLQRLHCETSLTLIAKRPLSGRSFVDQHVMLFYHLVRQVTLILKALVSEC